ncbi:MAG: 5'/3'-nucleotidase SurE, partial [Nitrospirae bacterium]|nr:5'/3'-nucleotidase SurE [Nitrospirota bacterium]
ITYSGTVAAAIEGTLLGVPSIAVSLVREDRNNSGYRNVASRFQIAADFARRIAEKVLDNGLPDDTLLNVNIPYNVKIKGVRITKQGKRVYDNAIQELHDPRGREYCWIGGGIPQWEPDENTDFEAIQAGYISVTPVHLDLTNYEALKFLEKNWGIK